MVHNLPVVNYGQGGQTRQPIERCPTGAIVWLAEGGKVEKGAAAADIVRKGERRWGQT
jgi:hypothetical protein